MQLPDGICAISNNKFICRLVLVFGCFLVIKFIEVTALGQIVEYKNENYGNRYFFRYLTDDFQEREESGELFNKGNDEYLVVKGSYSYITDNIKYKVTYEADENGYRAKTSTSLVPLGSLDVQARIVPVGRIASTALASLSGGGIG